MSQTEGYSPEDSLSDYSEGLLQRNMVYSTVLCLVREKNIKKSGIHSFRILFFKKKSNQHIYIESV